MGCVTKNCFIWEAKVCHGIIIDLDQVNDMIEAGILPIDRDGYILSPEGEEALKGWVKTGMPALDPDAKVDMRDNSGRKVDPDARVDVKPHSSGLVGSSTDAGDRLYHLTIKKMGEEKLSYRDALIEAQKENPELARRVVRELDEFRGRNKPDRLKR